MQKKVKNRTPLEKEALFGKQYPSELGGTVSVPLCRWGTETVARGAPNYGQANRTPSGTISVPFFLSVL